MMVNSQIELYFTETTAMGNAIMIFTKQKFSKFFNHLKILKKSLK
jgi:hypothetical protein